ncbi:MAG: NYN domain-containing protein [Selenomonadaceae bacterium]|nr:NYN domain-containing protein [Selenomonadaceae bacterium]
MATKKIALFIDADNVSAKFGKQIIDELSQRGEIFIRRIYGNWEKNILHGWNECILNFSLRAVQQTDFVAGKNATDMSLTIDAMDVLYGGRADVFALVSNDSDFTPLAIRLRESGINVVGLGNGRAANSFRMACSEFIDLDAPVREKFPIEQISKPIGKKSTSKGNSPVQLSLFAEDKIVELKPQPSTEKISSPKVAAQIQSVTNPKVVSLDEQRQLQSELDKKIQSVHEILSEVAKIHGDEQGFTPLCWAGQTLRQKDFGFGIKDVGYSSFRTFVEAFPKLYEVILRPNGENYCFRCLGTAPPIDEKIQSVHKILSEVAKIHGDEQGFTPLCWAGDTLRKKNFGFGIKDVGYSSFRRFVEAFPKLYAVRNVGLKFYYRCLTDTPKISANDSTLSQLHDALREAWAFHKATDDFTNLAYAGSAISQKSLSIKGSGHGTLQNFIAAFPKLYEIRTVNTTVSYRCLDSAKISNDEKVRQLHDVLREVWALYTSTDGFVNLWWACDFIVKKNFPRELKSMSYKDLLEFISACSERYEVRDDGGNNFSYRYRTDVPKISVDDSKVRQLHDALRDAAKFHGDDTGFVSPVQAGQYIRDKNLNFSVKDFGYATVRDFVSAFPELYEISKDETGQHFRYRPR